MNVSIDGFWSSRAGDYSPQQRIVTNPPDYRFFYRLNQDSTQNEKVIVRICLNGQKIAEYHDWMSTNGREDMYFDVPLALRIPGTNNKLQFRVYEPESTYADAEAGDLIYTSDEFLLEYV